jgi:hypothetical protein
LAICTVTAAFGTTVLFVIYEIVFNISHERSRTLVEYFISMAGVFLLSVFFITLLGIPIFLCLFYLNRLTTSNIGIIGLLSGFLLVLFKEHYFSFPEDNLANKWLEETSNSALYGAIPGLVSSLTFFYVWLKLSGSE